MNASEFSDRVATQFVQNLQAAKVRPPESRENFETLVCVVHGAAGMARWLLGHKYALAALGDLPRRFVEASGHVGIVTVWSGGYSDAFRSALESVARDEADEILPDFFEEEGEEAPVTEHEGDDE